MSTENCPCNPIPAEDIILKSLGVTDTAEFKAAAAGLAMAGLTAQDLERIAELHRRGDLELPEDEPGPGPDLSLFPEGRGNARALRVNGVVGTYFQEGGYLYLASLTGGHASYSYRLDKIEAVEPVTILGDDEAPLVEALRAKTHYLVPRERIERAKRRVIEWEAGVLVNPASTFLDLARDLAALGEDDR